MRRSSRRMWQWGAAGLTLALCVPLGGCDNPTAPKDPVQAELDVARAATTRYRDVAIALQEGFVSTVTCVSGPLGTMGVHYVNVSRLDGRLTAAEPEVLLYLPENGGMRLVAVEYVQPVMENGQPYFGESAPANPGATPALFGQNFQGPMPGHISSEPWHYDLHVWLWADNPAGRFAQFNPQLSCP